MKVENIYENTEVFIIKAKGFELVNEDGLFRIVNENTKTEGNTLVYTEFGVPEEWYEDDNEYFDAETLEVIKKGEEIDTDIDGKVYMVYNTSFTPETNKRLLEAYIRSKFPDIDLILNNISDMKKCLGNTEEVKALVKEEYRKFKDEDSIEVYLEWIDEKAKDAELSNQIAESRNLDEKIGQAEELLSEFEKQDPEKNKEEQIQGDN